MKNDEWLTPPEILAKLGPFDLDPCAPIDPPWSTARRSYNVLNDGLSQPREPRSVRVWLNPPFGNQAATWLQRWGVEHGNTIALVPARTETRMFFEQVWPRAHAVLFLKGRPHFHYVDGTRAPFNSGAPICLVAYGENNALAFKTANLGQVIELQPTPTHE